MIDLGPDLPNALCRGADPEIWHPTVGTDVTLPRSVCKACPDRADCLEYAVRKPEPMGIWGGVTARGRRRLRRELQRRRGRWTGQEMALWYDRAYDPSDDRTDRRRTCRHCGRLFYPTATSRSVCPDPGCGRKSQRGRRARTGTAA